MYVQADMESLLQKIWSYLEVIGGITANTIICVYLVAPLKTITFKIDIIFFQKNIYNIFTED